MDVLESLKRLTPTDLAGYIGPMFRLRSKSGDESVFRSAEEIRAALLSGFVTPDAQIWDAELKGWVPLLEHALYQQIASAPGARKSSSVNLPPTAPSAGPPGVKPVSKLVIRRPGEGATTAIPAVKPPAPTAPPPAPPRTPSAFAASDEIPDLELIDLDLTPEPVAPVPAPLPPPKPAPAPPAARPPAPPTPSVVSTPAPAPEPAPPRLSIPRASTPAMASLQAEEPAEGRSKKGLVIVAVVLLVAAGVGYALFGRGSGAESPAVDSSALDAPVAIVVDTTPKDSVAADTTKRDSVVTPPAAAVAPTDTARPVAAAATNPAPNAVAPMPFAPVVGRGPAPWTARPVVGAPLTIPSLEVVRLRYLAAQSRALEQFESGLAAVGFNDLFDPARVSNSGRREESLDAVDAGRSALRDFRRRQAAIDFAYTDSMRQALPAGSDTPDFRTFGPILREGPAQAALTDSIVGEVAEIYGMLVGEVGGYTFRGGMLTWKEGDNADRYRTLQERLTSQIARVRTRNPGDVPPAMAALLRGIGLPR